MSRMTRPFFPMAAGDRWYLVILIAIAVIAFTPWSRTTEMGGLPVFGWLMAALMVLAPVIALARLLMFDRNGSAGRRPQ
jgi:hypothetical protein